MPEFLHVSEEEDDLEPGLDSLHGDMEASAQSDHSGKPVVLVVFYVCAVLLVVRDVWAVVQQCFG